MASVNKVIILGNLGTDPEVKDAGDNIICNLNVATSRRYNDRNGQQVEETEWHRVSFFGRTAEIARDYLRKGSQCYVEGRLRTRKYTDKNGVEKYSTEIVGQTLQLLDRRTDSAQDESFDSAPRRAPQAPRQAAAPRPATRSSGRNEYEDVPF